MPTRYTNVKLTNGVFDHWTVTKDVTSPRSATPPTQWDINMIMNATFDGFLGAGNLDAAFLTIDGFRIKRRRADEFDWITIKYIDKNNIDDYSFIVNDNLALTSTTYEYAIVPVTGGVEGEYISAFIDTNFNGVFIADMDTIYRFYAGVEYGAQERVQKVGVFEPYGRKYPVVVANGEISYDTGSVSGTVLPNTYLQDKDLNRKEIKDEIKRLNDFLTNKKAKILKDWNEGCWLMVVTGNPTTTYAANIGMGIADVRASWAQVGDANNQQDLIDSGIVKEV